MPITAHGFCAAWLESLISEGVKHYGGEIRWFSTKCAAPILMEDVAGSVKNAAAEYEGLFAQLRRPNSLVSSAAIGKRKLPSRYARSRVMNTASCSEDLQRENYEA